MYLYNIRLPYWKVFPAAFIFILAIYIGSEFDTYYCENHQFLDDEKAINFAKDLFQKQFGSEISNEIAKSSNYKNNVRGDYGWNVNRHRKYGSMEILEVSFTFRRSTVSYEFYYKFTQCGRVLESSSGG